MSNIKTRDDVIKLLGRAAFRGRLGLFLGTGFSIAVTKGAAPRWTKLLVDTAAVLKIPNPLEKPEQIIGMSLPEVASKMVSDLAAAIGANPLYKDASSSDLNKIAEGALKESAALLVAAIQPAPDEVAVIHPLIRRIDPAWVVTTNYDDLFEKIHGKTQAFLPSDVVICNRGLLPVWHIHGSSMVPQSMIITQADYVESLRPATYRQSNLAHMMLESTTLMLGYNYGDINVQTAASIARSVGLLGIRADRRPEDSYTVQAIYTSAPLSPDVRIARDGTILIDIGDIKALLQEIDNEVNRLAAMRQGVDALFTAMTNDPDGLVQTLLATPTLIERMTQLLREYPESYFDFEVINVLRKFFSGLSSKAYSTGGFPHYSTWLKNVLTMLLNWENERMPIAVFELLASQLATVVYNIDPQGRHVIGKSWEATDAWVEWHFPQS